MRTTLLPSWILLGAAKLIWHEVEDDDNVDDQKPDDKAGSGGEGGEDNKDEKDEKPDGDTAGLKSALAAERAKNKKLERERAADQKTKDDAALKDKTEIEQATIREQKATERATKLAAAFRTSAITSAVKEEAAALKFIDPTDALTDAIFAQIEADQDEDNPADVTIDKASVTKAIKALAAAKPHLVLKGTDDGEPTGSSYGNSSRTKPKSKSEEDRLRQLYPSLNT